MNRVIKYIGMSLITVLIILSLAACNEELRKPTGLENDDNNNQVASVLEQESENEITEVALEKKRDIQIDDSSEDGLDERADDTNDSSNDSNPNSESLNELETDRNQSTQSGADDDQNTTHNKTEKTSNKSKHVTNNDTNKKADETEETDLEPEAESELDEEKEDEAEEKQTNTIVYSIVISDMEVPLPATEMEFMEGDTVLEALIRITRDKKIQMDYRGGRGATAYVEGIDNVYEFDRGQGSGWMYRVNGVFPDRSAGVIPLLPGDHVEWLYTTNLGEDLGADLEPFRR